MPSVSQSTIDKVTNGKYGTRDWQEFIQPDQFSESLESVGYRPVSQISVPARHGKWAIYQREFLSQTQQAPESALALYAKDGRVKYLFMPRPEVSPNLEEMVQNAQIITSGLLEKNPSGTKIALKVAAVGAALSVVASEIISYFTGFNNSNPLNNPSIIGNPLAYRVLFDFSCASFGALLSGLFAANMLIGYDDSISSKTVARMSNPENYLYGNRVSTQVKADLAFEALHSQPGAGAVSRESFGKALSPLGI